MATQAAAVIGIYPPKEIQSMNISEICIRRPIFTWVLVGIPVVLGMVAYFGLGVDLFPKVDFPRLIPTRP